MTEKYDIAGYCRISVDDELDKDNTSIENQKSIIEDYVKRTFPGSRLTFYEDRDRSGYTFEQRENYQVMRKKLLSKGFDILIVKDLSRFSRRNGHGLVELENLKDAGVRLIAIGDNIDYPTNDDWMRIQFYFLMNEMPVTDTSKKVKNVIKRRQEDGKWICAVPYGYVITNYKTMTFEVEPNEAEVVRQVFSLYLNGWGYKKIANHLTEQNIPTPRMNERARIEARGEECHLKVRPEWSIVTVQGILSNDFYIGTLRQGKFTRKKINGADVKKDESEHIVFENHHEAIVDFRTFAIAQEALKSRSTNHYRGVKKYDNVYSGFMVCGDCGSPMFPMSRPDLKDAYRCGKYHRMGVKGCTSHHIRTDVLDDVLKGYLRNVKETSAKMVEKLNKSIENESELVKAQEDAAQSLEEQLADANAERAMLSRQMTRELMRNPNRAEIIENTYETLIEECDKRIEGLNNQITLTHDKRNTVIWVNRIARETIDIIDSIVDKGKLDKKDLEFIIDKIYVYEDHIHIKLKSDIECILKSGVLPEQSEEAANFNLGVIDSLKTVFVQTSEKRRDKVYDVNVISSGDPLEIYTDRDGEVIFKKYSPIGELTTFAAQYAETLHKTCGLSIIICDRDTVIASSGVSKKEYADRKLSEELEGIIESRQQYKYNEFSGDAKKFYVTDGAAHHIRCAMPIISEGDLVGCVVSVAAGDSATTPINDEIESKLISTAASFLGKQLEA